MKTCIEITDLAFPIKLEQSETGPQLFKVTYGKQIRHKLLYEEAAEELGAAIMHALACDGKLDNI